MRFAAQETMPEYVMRLPSGFLIITSTYVVLGDKKTKHPVNINLIQ